MNAKVKLTCAVFALGVFLAGQASGTTLVRLSLDQLTQASSDVLQGHVVNQISQWNPAHTEIVTLTTISVDQNVKGNTPATVVVEQLGGTIGHLHVNVPATVHFLPGARYELFLQHAALQPSTYLLVGMMQGAFRVYRDPTTRQERVVSPTGYFYHGVTRSSGELAPSPATMPLTEFQQQVSTALAKPIVIPDGVSIPLIVRSASFDGAGRILLEAQTAADVYPNRSVVIPAGSLVDGWATERAGRWTIHWTGISIGNR
ncbi:MAG: hypothetical protein ACRD1J_11710, partial [Terriglobia bacterium]